jgi:flagellar motility protein MotE (MotC chaperone)
MVKAMSVATIVAAAIAVAPAAAWPRFDDTPAESMAKVAPAARKGPLPAVVPSACPAPSEVPPISAAALIEELKKNNARRGEIKAAADALAGERAEIAAERERLAAERIDLDLIRAELAALPQPAPAVVPQNRDEEVKKLSATVKVMSAERAASVVAILDRQLAAGVMRSLSRPAAAAIYERLPPEKAAAIMQEITAPATEAP